MDSNLKNLLPIVVAIVLGVISIITVNRYITAKTQTDEVKKISIVTAAQTIGAGTEISVDQLAVKDVPADLVSGVNITVPSGSSPQVQEEVQLRKAMLVGRKSVRLIPAGDPILWTDFTKADATTLSDKIPEGRRAVTIPVDTISGVGLNIVPGDRVDVLGSKEQGCGGGTAAAALNPALVRDLMGGVPPVAASAVEGTAQPNAPSAPLPEPITYVLMQNVLVLAIGQNFNPDIIGGGISAYTNVTLEVSLEEAVMLTHARNQAVLSLVLRPQTGLDRLPADQLLSVNCSTIMKKYAPEFDAKRARETAPPPAPTATAPAPAPAPAEPGATP